MQTNCLCGCHPILRPLCLIAVGALSIEECEEIKLDAETDATLSNLGIFAEYPAADDF